jgi:hypothetical protein
MPGQLAAYLEWSCDMVRAVVCPWYNHRAHGSTKRALTDVHIS